MDFIFRNLCSLSTLVFTYSNASSSHIPQYQGPMLQVCSAHQIKLIVTWLCQIKLSRENHKKELKKLRPF